MPAFLRLHPALWLTSLLVLVGGCSSGAPLVKIKGKLVNGGQPVGPDPNRSFTLVFVPLGEGQPQTTHVGVITDPGGEFEVAGPDLRGVPLGKYRVKIQTTDPAPSARVQALQQQFGNDQSPILVDVQKDQAPLVIDLASYKSK